MCNLMDKPAAPAAKFVEKDVDEWGFSKGAALKFCPPSKCQHPNFAPTQSACIQMFASPDLSAPHTN